MFGIGDQQVASLVRRDRQGFRGLHIIQPASLFLFKIGLFSRSCIFSMRARREPTLIPYKCGRRARRRHLVCEETYSYLSLPRNAQKRNQFN